jgi:hypothetical protein
VHDVEDPVGEAGLAHQLGEQQRRGRILLARLQHDRVPARERVGRHPERHHDREVEGCDAGDDTDRLQDGVDVDAPGDLGAVRPLEQVGDAAGELDALERAGQLPLGVGPHLAMLAGDQRGEVVGARVDELAQPEEHPRARAQRRAAPRERRVGGDLDHVAHLARRRQRDLGGLLARGRVVHGCRAAGCGGQRASAHPVRNLLHGVLLGSPAG